MINKSKIVLIAALVAATNAASPAFAQAFSKGYGTGNVTPYAFEPSRTAAPRQRQIRRRRHAASGAMKAS
jgi:hypothetical protein